MLSFLIRRLAVSGVALAGLAGVGVVFGGASLPGTYAPILAENATISGIPAPGVAQLEPAIDSPQGASRSAGRRGPDIAWPFFSFTRQRAGGSW